MSHLDEVPMFCVMCSTEVPLERKRKRSVTCSDDCSKKRGNYLRERKELRKCKYCNQPSTPEERDDFRAWRRDRKAQAKAKMKETTVELAQ